MRASCACVLCAALLALCLAHRAQGQAPDIGMFPECMERARELEAVLERHPSCHRALKAVKRCPITTIEVDACAKTIKEPVMVAMRACEQAAANEGGLRFWAKMGGPCKFGEKLGTMDEFET
eukprot:evm.model.scf_860.4 EVM.evm.TU.scf_860.4   scf_860:32034-33010(-)